jgi:hypothetical protein
MDHVMQIRGIYAGVVGRKADIRRSKKIKRFAFVSMRQGPHLEWYSQLYWIEAVEDPKPLNYCNSARVKSDEGIQVMSYLKFKGPSSYIIPALAYVPFGCVLVRVRVRDDPALKNSTSSAISRITEQSRW